MRCRKLWVVETWRRQRGTLDNLLWFSHLRSRRLSFDVIVALLLLQLLIVAGFGAVVGVATEVRSRRGRRREEGRGGLSEAEGLKDVWSVREQRSLERGQ